MNKELKEALDEHYCKEFLPREWFDKPGAMTISEHMHFTAEYFCEWGRKRMLKEACEWLDKNAAKYIVRRPVHEFYMIGLDASMTDDFRKAMEDKI